MGASFFCTDGLLCAFVFAADERCRGMTIIPYPSADVPLAASKALADDHLSEDLKVLLRGLLSTDLAERVKAMSGLVGFEVDVAAGEYSVADDDGEDSVGPLDDPSALRLLPALVALAEIREDAERFSHVTCAANIELNRLMEGEEEPAGFEASFEEARKTALGLAAAALAAPVDEEEILRPLMMVVAVFNGQVDLAMTLLGFDGDLDDEDEDEAGDEDDGEASDA